MVIVHLISLLEELRYHSSSLLLDVAERLPLPRALDDWCLKRRVDVMSRYFVHNLALHDAVSAFFDEWEADDGAEQAKPDEERAQDGASGADAGGAAQGTGHGPP